MTTTPTPPLLGYADRLSVRPGETVAVKVSCTLAEDFSASLVRIICADPNPSGPGIIEESVPANFAGATRHGYNPLLQDRAHSSHWETI